MKILIVEDETLLTARAAVENRILSKEMILARVCGCFYGTGDHGVNTFFVQLPIQ